MSIRVLVPEGMAARLQQFAASAEIPVEVVTCGDADLQVIPCPEGERLESDLQTLRAGGYITCATALSLADKLGLSPDKLGALLNFLDIKVRACNLGCFK